MLEEKDLNELIKKLEKANTEVALADNHPDKILERLIKLESVVECLFKRTVIIQDKQKQNFVHKE